MDQAQPSKYWVDAVVKQIMSAHPKGEIIVSSGHSPSGNYHVGTLRELLTANAIAFALRAAGREARHIDFVDDFDALRKIPQNVPESWREHLGKPLYLVPDPFGCHGSYGAHFLADLYAATKAMGMELETVYAHEAYPAGTFTTSIEAALDKLDKVKAIIQEVSGRELPEGWVPVQILSDNNSLREWKFKGWDKARQVVEYQTADGSEGEVSYTAGRVKLDWRLDWPARWAIWKVAVEPFGRDHATKGGSYDTGSRLVSEIFGGTAPHPIPYDFVNKLGATKKMSKSAGDVITALGALEIMPPEILRYFILRSLPARTLVFDSGLGLYNLIDEYAKVEQAVKAGEKPDFAEAYALASAQTEHQTISSIPFNHLVSVYQAARGEYGAIFEILVRTGYKKAVEEEHKVLEAEFEFVKNWLAKYAPDSVKFEVQSELPKVDLNSEQTKFLGNLADALADAQNVDGQRMHELIYEAKEAADVKPAEAFQALYRVILGKDSGPKAGWFLASLDHDWLVSRLHRKG